MTTAVLPSINADADWADVDLPMLQHIAAALRAPDLPGHSLLQQIATALRAPELPRERAPELPGECLYRDPIRSYPHAQHVMHLHRGHQCPRHRLAARYEEAKH
ncbi:hypothetical protein [Nocardia sp. CA-290969]|uniref:hypothetical protein n=1 Tax=Nocardia sp. CA-290969 TaxID=3239986 RepID=UPI003D8FC7D7